MDNPEYRKFESEWIFSASRSSGPGGQHVNKVSSKVELRFNINQTILFTEDEKELIKSRLAGRINKDGDLIIVAQTERSQAENKERTIERFFHLVEQALKIQKPRKKTNPTAGSLAKRRKSKQVQSFRKDLRRKIIETE